MKKLTLRQIAIIAVSLAIFVVMMYGIILCFDIIGGLMLEHIENKDADVMTMFVLGGAFMTAVTTIPAIYVNRKDKPAVAIIGIMSIMFIIACFYLPAFAFASLVFNTFGLVALCVYPDYFTLNK